MPPTAGSPRWSGFRAHQLANSLGLQIQGAPHLVPSAGRAMSDLSPAIRSGFIDSNKMHGHVLLAHVRQHQADLDFKISAVETHGAQGAVSHPSVSPGHHREE
jgi:hypothetical protein